jgi:hypothetical protein
MPAVLCHRHAVEAHLQVPQRVLDDRALGVGDDPEPQARLTSRPQRQNRVGERLPAVAGARPPQRAVAAGLFQTFTHVGGAIVLAVLVVCPAAWGLDWGFGVASCLLPAAAAAALVFLRSSHLHLQRDVVARANPGWR